MTNLNNVTKSINTTAFIGLLCVFIFFSGIANAVTTLGSGAWNSTAPGLPWPGGVVPAAGDPVTIDVGHTVTVSAPASCLSLTLNTGTGGGGILDGVSTLTLFGNVTVSYGSGAMTSGALISCSLALGSANRIFTVADDGTSMADLTVTGVISGVRSVTKAGAGSMTLSATNTYTLGTTLSAGTLNINSAAALGTTAGTFVISGGTIDNTSAGAVTLGNYPMTLSGDFTFTGTNALNLGAGAKAMATSRIITCSASTLTIGGVISGAGKLTKAGGGTLNLTGANTFTGGFQMDAGTIVLGNNSALGALAGTITINGGTFDVNAARAMPNNPHIWNAGFTFTGTNTLSFGTGAKTMNADISITSNASTLTIQGVISGVARKITKLGAGALSLTGANTFTGGVQLSAGTLNIGHAAALGTIAGTFIIDGGTTVNVTTAITLGNYPQTWNGSFAYTGTNTLNMGTGAKTMTADVTITANASTLTIGGIISGAFRFTKAGAGTVDLTGVNTYSGGTTMDAGTLTLTNSKSNTGGYILNGGTLNLNHAQALGPIANTLTINGGAINSSVAAIVLTILNPQIWNASFAYTGTQNLSFAAGAITMNADITVTCNGGATRVLTLPGVISGAFRLTKAGPSILALNGNNTYSGGTTVDAGTLTLTNTKSNTGGYIFNGGTTNVNHASALGPVSNTLTFNGGTINNSTGAAITTVNYPQIWNAGFTFGGTRALSLGTGGITLNADVIITVNGNTNALTLAGVISGAFRVTKAGAGTLALTGNNTYSGGTTMNLGTLTLTNAKSNTGGFILNGGTLNINHAQALGPVANTLTINGGAINSSAAAVTMTVANPQTWNASFNYTGTQSLSFNTGAITLNADITINCTGAANRILTLNGIISGAFRITKAGAGTLALAGNNTYSGGTTMNLGTLTLTNAKSNTGGFILNAGILNINHAQALGTVANVFTINGGTINSSVGTVNMTVANPQIWNASFIFTGTQSLRFSTGAITLNADITINCPGAITRTLTYLGSISGAFKITKTGIGVLALQGANTHSGGTTLSAGVLNINNATALGNTAGTFTVEGGTINNSTGATITNSQNNPIALNGDFIFTGTRDLNLGTGAITMSASRSITSSTAGRTLTLGGVINNNTQNITKLGAGIVSFGTTAKTLNALTISAGTLIGTSDVLSLSGDFTNNATFTHNSGTVKFNGAAGQSITGATTSTFYKLELDNVSGLTLSTAAVVANQLILTEGIITATSLLTLNSGATSNVGSATSYVVKTMRKIGNQDFTFPIGKATFWAPIGISNFTAGDATTAFEASYNDVGVAKYEAREAGLTKVSFVEQWDLHHAAGTAPTVQVTLHWKDSVRSAVHPKGDATSSDLIVAHWNGTEWESMGQSAVTMDLVGSVTSGPMSSFSPVAPGSIAPDADDIALPVELLDFKVVQSSEGNSIKWTTGSEINNDYFVVEKSRDGIHFNDLFIVDGKGNYSGLSEYSIEDKNPFQNHTYYRLKQVDFDGTIAFSKIVVLHSEAVSDQKISIFPNPMDASQEFALTFYDIHNKSQILVTLRDVSGKEYYSKQMLLNQEESLVFTIELEQELSPGIYIISGSVDDSVFNKKLIVR